MQGYIQLIFNLLNDRIWFCHEGKFDVELQHICFCSWTHGILYVVSYLVSYMVMASSYTTVFELNKRFLCAFDHSRALANEMV